MATTWALANDQLETGLPLLYDIPPIGVGTLFVESMEHYIVRVAEAHCVSPRSLLGYLGSPYKQVTPRLDGPAELAWELVRVLCDLSPRDDIQLTSLARWHNVLSSRHCIERKPRHCPICSTEDSSYTRLMWSIWAVTVCPIHRVLLVPTNEHVIKHPSKEELAWQLYVNSQLSGLLTYDGFPTMKRGEFSALCLYWLQSVTDRTRPGVSHSHTSRILQIADTWKYFPKSLVPSLSTSLMLAEHFDIPLITLLTGDVPRLEA